jgi:RNA polymerase subunit RPABC4/transcription elongation factor Spt4
MSLSEADFTRIVGAGCPACSARSLTIEALVPQRVPLLGGEPYGAPSWGYKGEDLVRGTYRVACEGCKKELFATADCPLCNAEGGVDRAQNEVDPAPLPVSCDRCSGDLLVATAFVPALLVYEGKRPSRPRAQAAPEEPGFHMTRVECKACHAVTERRDPCPLCGAPRPG